MKQLVKAAILFAFAFAASSGALRAQHYTLTLDENGHGTVNGNPMIGTLMPDPSGGITTTPVLVYTLPYDVQGGDVALLEPGLPNAPISDLIRFFEPTPGGPTSFLIFYSDIEAGEHLDLADVGIPASHSPVMITEVGPEGNNGAVYSATTLPNPGVPLLGGPVTGTAEYNIISDVPEPGPGTLLFTGLILGWGVSSRRKRGFALKT